MKSKVKPELNDLVQSIGKLARTGQQLASRAVKEYSPEVADILQTQCRDPRQIEHLLDRMLGFGFKPPMVLLFKKLCRYYFDIDPNMAASYVNTYRDMWDEEGQEKN